MGDQPWFNIVKIGGGERQLLDTLMATDKFDALDAFFGHQESFPEVDGLRVPVVLCVTDGSIIVPEPIRP